VYQASRIQPKKGVVVALSLCSSFLICAITMGHAQHTIMATVRREKGNALDAVRITGIKIDGQFYSLAPLEPPAPFKARFDWINHAQIIAKNVSNKTMIAGRLKINCPGLGQIGKEPPAIFDMLVLGQIPQRFSRSADDPEPSDATKARAMISVPPNGEVVFMVDADSTGLRSRLNPSANPDACEIGLRDFHFADGSMWMPRQFFKPNPQSDHGYIRISASEFDASRQRR
jgi:hypothetical protein